MATFNSQNADQYGSAGTGGFFSLKNHGDTAKVRYMYEGIEDVIGFAVHQVEIGGKNRYVDCLKEPGDSVDVCPLCAAGIKVIAKIFVPLYDIEAKEIKIWDRGKTYMRDLSSLCSRYGPALYKTVFEIERNGAKGDTSTKYTNYPLTEEKCPDGFSINDLPPIPDVVGTIVLKKSYEELEKFMQTGTMPNMGPSPEGARRSVDVHKDEPVKRAPF